MYEWFAREIDHTLRVVNFWLEISMKHFYFDHLSFIGVGLLK